VYSYRNKKANQHYCALLEEELGLKISTIWKMITTVNRPLFSFLYDDRINWFKGRSKWWNQ